MIYYQWLFVDDWRGLRVLTVYNEDTDELWLTPEGFKLS